MTEVSNAAATRELIAFRIGEQEFCVDIMSVREIRGWTNMECCMYHDRGKDMRQLIRTFEWFWPGAIPGKPSDDLKFQILVTTYDEVIKDVEELAGVAWRALVVDEAHRLKSLNSRLLECLHQILGQL